jgi:hypothetical protein
VALACFAAAVFERRSWLGFVTRAAGPLIKLGRLPAACASAFSASFVSGSVAGLMLSDSRKQELVTRKQMILCAVCCSAPASLTFSLTAMFPVIAAIGTAGALYYAVTHGISAVLTVTFLLLLRRTSSADSPVFSPGSGGKRKTEKWGSTFLHAWSRTRVVMTRVVTLTIPLFLLTSYAVSRGFFTGWSSSAPAFLGKWLTPETLGILGARMGGMLAASGITAELLANGKTTLVQAVFALLLGNIISNPIRTMRRTLPVSLGLYPGYDGAVIALTVLGSRLLLNLIVLTAIVLIFN